MGTTAAVIAAASAAVVAFGFAAIAVLRMRARADRRLHVTLERIGGSMETLSESLLTVVERAAQPPLEQAGLEPGLSIDLDEVMARTAELAADALRADGVAVEVRLADGDHVAAAYGVPGPRATLESALEAPDRGSWQAVRLEWAPDPRAVGDGVRSALAVPIERDAERLGTIVAYSRLARSFSSEDEETLRTLAADVAPAIVNARRHAEVLELVRTDKLTRIWNRAGYDEALQLELARAQRSERPLALLLVDLDDFGAVNKRYGLPTGDDLLAGFADVLRRTARLTDIVCRRGGEEFAFILPETACREAIRLYARLRTEVELTDFPEIGAMTFSAGLTELRQGDTIRSIDERASRLVNDAKAAGKNRLSHDCNGGGIVGPDLGAAS